MHNFIHIPRYEFAPDVLNAIEQTIGTLRAETGGIIGGDKESGRITKFHFDPDAVASTITFTLNGPKMNRVIASWNAQGVSLMGVIHSHRAGLTEPSFKDHECGNSILGRHDNREMDSLLLPIVQSKADGAFSMRLFAVNRRINNALLELPYTVSPDNSQKAFPIPSTIYEQAFGRLRDTYDLPLLYNTMIIIVGCGGAASHIEDLARAGNRFFILIDRDVVEASNIGTSQFYWNEIGMSKVEALSRRIKNINPLACVTTIHDSAENLSDSEFEELIFPSSPNDIQNRLLCAFTDAFLCQARIARLGLHLSVPTLAAQVYKGGSAAEIVFMHPSTTKQCIRCVLGNRYRAFLREGIQNGAGSKGAQYIATPRLNATKLTVAMAIIHHGSDHSFWGPMLKRIGQRNCIQIRCDPDVEQKLGLRNFDSAFSNGDQKQIFFDETIWRPQHPENSAHGYGENCPDCGGCGDLAKLAGTFSDTRIIPN